MISIKVEDQQLRAALRHLTHALVDMSPAMRKIAGTLAKVTDDNFAAQGRPSWPALAESTKAQRADPNGPILMDTGRLANSVSTKYDAQQATIGSNVIYAAIQQFGGEAGRGHQVTIPARPYLPMSESGLQPEASDEVLDTVLRHLKTAAGV